MSLFDSLFDQKETSNKIGKVRKCPQCGTNVPASKVICPECGWEFDEDVNAKGILHKLSEEVKKTKGFFSMESEEDVISAFPIPKVKSDLLELTIYFKAKVKNIEKQKNTENFDINLFEAYKEKYAECIMKAKQFYAQDPSFTKLINEYDEEEIKEEKKIKAEKRIQFILPVVILIILGIIFAIMELI